MDDILDTIESERDFTDKEIFLEIWTKPRLVFRYLHRNKYDKHVGIILTVAGISNAFERAIKRNLGDSMELITIIVMATIAGAVFGWISYFFYAFLVSYTGKWMGGTQDTHSIHRVFGYAVIPACIGFLFFILQASLYGIELFKSEDTMNIGSETIDIILFFGLAIFQLILGVWSIVLMVIGLAEIQNFSIGKSFLNLITPVLIVVVPIIVLIMLVANF